VQDGDGFIDGCATASGVLSGGWIVNQRDMAHGEIPLVFAPRARSCLLIFASWDEAGTIAN
jgi:hypothetical protein